MDERLIAQTLARIGAGQPFRVAVERIRLTDFLSSLASAQAQLPTAAIRPSHLVPDVVWVDFAGRNESWNLGATPTTRVTTNSQMSAEVPDLKRPAR